MITLKRHEENEAKLLMTQEKMRKFERRRDLVGQFIFLAIVVGLIIWASSRFGGTETDSIKLDRSICALCLSVGGCLYATANSCPRD